MSIAEIISAVQTKLGITADGVAGPKTWGTIYRSIVNGEKDADTHSTPADISVVDDRSEKAIATLLPQVRPYARALVQQCAAQGIAIVITSGSRTYAEQDALYALGRDEPGPKVTNARGGYSNHNFGIAFDVTIFSNGKPVWESPLYKVVGGIGRNIGLSWGGDWVTINDEPHFELHPAWAKDMSESGMLKELRRRHDAGESVF
jgi:peptidoglycan L-alanyl-D-glutamate endopeptidase CwlK